MMKRSVLWLLAGPGFTFAANAAELPATPQTTAPIVTVVRQTPPSVASKVNLSWPGALDREALVILEFNISASGEVSDIQLADGGFYDRRFADAAIRGLKKLKFNPATINGVPTETTGARVPFRFKLDIDDGVTPEFRNELNKVNAFLKRGDYAGGHFHAEWMLSEKVKYLYEYAVLQAELAYTHASVGNTHRALVAARDATRRVTPQIQQFDLHQPIPPNDARNYVLPKAAVVGMLGLRMKLAASRGFFLEAMQSYQELAGLEDIAPDDARAKLAAALTAALDGDQPLVGHARIDEAKVWLHEPYRRSFSIENVRGALAGMLLYCAGKSRALAYQPDIAFTIPATWGGCMLSFSGEPGTEFDIVEYTAVKPEAPVPNGG